MCFYLSQLFHFAFWWSGAVGDFVKVMETDSSIID
jgi:hypothetical protein